MERLGRASLMAGRVARANRAARGACALALGGALGAMAWNLVPAPRVSQAAAALAIALCSAALALTLRLRDRIGHERQALDARASAVAHDLRSPLVTVHSYLDLLTDEAFGPLPADARAAAEGAARAVRRAQTLVESVLHDHARRDAVRPLDAAAEAERVVDLDGVLRDVLAALAGEIAGACASVEVAPLPRVRGDAIALYRVFANLVQNGVKYARPGDIARVRVSADPVGRDWEIVVRDWGIGIPAAERERVFGERARGVAMAARPGDGLGLATVQRLVAEQRGRVWVDPGVTDGACIRLLLPAA